MWINCHCYYISYKNAQVILLIINTWCVGIVCYNDRIYRVIYHITIYCYALYCPQTHARTITQKYKSRHTNYKRTRMHIDTHAHTACVQRNWWINRTNSINQIRQACVSTWCKIEKGKSTVRDEIKLFY